MTCPINPDFLDEIIMRLRIRPEDYDFIDIGAGKGAALMIANKFPFRRFVAIEFSASLVEIGRRNVDSFAKVIGRPVEVEWVCQDFMTYDLPAEPAVLFLNNPFPNAVSLRAARHIEESLRARPRRLLMVWRKPSPPIARYLDQSPYFRPLEWSPYWRAYESVLP
jgi:tRNA1(Val) A37 N6-methylase TrmN6